MNQRGSRGNRPTVLAHERFLEHRQGLTGLALADRFSRIYETNLWGAGTSVSGLGSESAATSLITREIGPMLRSLGVRTLLDAPCGDAGWIARADLAGISYIGVDVVPNLVEQLRREKPGLGPFLIADVTRDALPAADAILCRDCLVHLSFGNIARAITNFRRTGAEWLVTTTFPEWHDNSDCEDGDWRALNLEQPPFCWPKPEPLLVEGCTEGEGGWSDKSLGFWRFAALPID
jgi:hypothetical protein